MNEVMIKIKNVSKKFGDLWAIKDLNLDVYKSEIFAFLGPNGAGKTTTLKLLTGLLKPTTGKIEIAGYDILTHPVDAKKLLAYIPDEPYLYEKLTGREFLNFVSTLYGIPKFQTEGKIQKFVEYFEMGSYIDDLIQGYSHGMKQRLVFSAAFIHDPLVIVIDEPLVGLDPASVRKVKQLLKAKAQQGVTVFVSTHTLSFAEDIATRIGIIDKGLLLRVGNLEELKAKSGIEGRLEEVFLKITCEQNA